jgi:hypothetical protein
MNYKKPRCRWTQNLASLKPELNPEARRILEKLLAHETIPKRQDLEGLKIPLVVFGDSLSDNGNSLVLFEVPQPPYYNGSLESRGPNWVDLWCDQDSAKLGFIRTAAIELARDNITINAVLPGNILIEGLQDLGEQYLKQMAASTLIFAVGVSRPSRAFVPDPPPASLGLGPRTCRGIHNGRIGSRVANISKTSITRSACAATRSLNSGTNDWSRVAIHSLPQNPCTHVIMDLGKQILRTNTTLMT